MCAVHNLAREPGADMLGDDAGLRVNDGVGDALQNGREIADRNALGQQHLQDPLDAGHRNLRGHDILEQLGLLLGSSFTSFGTSAYDSRSETLAFSLSVRWVDSTVARSTTV